MTETSDENGFMRITEIRFGNEVVVVNAMFIDINSILGGSDSTAIDKNKINECRAIAEKIERSLKF